MDGVNCFRVDCIVPWLPFHMYLFFVSFAREGMGKVVRFFCAFFVALTREGMGRVAWDGKGDRHGTEGGGGVPPRAVPLFCAIWGGGGVPPGPKKACHFQKSGMPRVACHFFPDPFLWG